MRGVNSHILRMLEGTVLLDAAHLLVITDQRNTKSVAYRRLKREHFI